MRILIVEDEPGIAAFLKEGLIEEGYRVEVAANGETGLDMALSNPYDLLLLDWMLPGLDGIEVCRAFRKKNTSTLVIFLTVKDAAGDVAIGLAAGANDYIKKPFAFDDLLARINAQLRSKSKGPLVPTEDSRQRSNP